MTESGLRAMSTGKLVRKFKKAAKQAGTIFTCAKTPKKIRQTPELRALVTKIRDLATELRERRPMSEIRAMFEDNDEDVRGWAAPQFHPIDPEWASATFSGLLARLSARDVLALRQRVLNSPLKSPDLTSMSTDALVTYFEDAATREYATRFVRSAERPRDMSLFNRIRDEVIDVMRELKRRDALEALLPLLDCPIITVRAEAAKATLTIAPERASAVLEAVIASDDQLELLDASFSLDDWREGRTVIYGVG
jgi:hypothetical protein